MVLLLTAPTVATGLEDMRAPAGHAECFVMHNAVFGGMKTGDWGRHRYTLERAATKARWPSAKDVLVLGLEVRAFQSDLFHKPGAWSSFGEHCERVAPGCAVCVEVTTDRFANREYHGYVIAVALCSPCRGKALAALVVELLEGFACTGSVGRAIFLTTGAVRTESGLALADWRTWLASVSGVDPDPFVDLVCCCLACRWLALRERH